MLLNFPSHGVSLLGAKKRCKFKVFIAVCQIFSSQFLHNFSDLLQTARALCTNRTI